MPLNPRTLRPSRNAPAFTPTDLAGIYAWWDADDASTFTTGFESPYISEWRDKSGNSRHLSQPNGADQPKRLTNQLNGKPTVVYDWTQYMDSNPLDWKFLHHGTDYYNVFCVMEPDLGDNGSAAWASTTGIYYGYEGFMGLLDRIDAGETAIDAAFGDYNSNAVNTALVLAQGSDINLARAIVATGRPSANLIRLRDNVGTADDGPTGTITTSSADPPYGFALGAEGLDLDGGMFPYGAYNGKFAEIIVYRSATDLTDANRNQVLSYLRTKWGLA